jgi:hypothetical protein
MNYFVSIKVMLLPLIYESVFFPFFVFSSGNAELQEKPKRREEEVKKKEKTWFEFQVLSFRPRFGSFLPSFVHLVHLVHFDLDLDLDLDVCDVVVAAFPNLFVRGSVLLLGETRPAKVRQDAQRDEGADGKGGDEGVHAHGAGRHKQQEGNLSNGRRKAKAIQEAHSSSP